MIERLYTGLATTTNGLVQVDGTWYLREDVHQFDDGWWHPVADCDVCEGCTRLLPPGSLQGHEHCDDCRREASRRLSLRRGHYSDV